MKNSIQKREGILGKFLKSMLVITLIACSQIGVAQKKSLQADDWKLAIQGWSFRLFTFTEALDKIDSAGVKYMEGFPNQKLGGDLEGNLDFHMDEVKMKKVLSLLKAKGIKMVSYGVVSPKTEEDWTQLFKFAKGMGLLNIVSEPMEEHIPLISKLCDEYQINVAIHNHPNPSHYWNPDILLAAIKGASPRLGACADVGHWIRSGLDPVESLKKLEGHVIEFHMKDLNEKGVRKAHDLVWGTGISDIPSIMQEMKRQQFKGVISIEYEHNWENNVPDIKASAEYFNQQKKSLLKK